jgi:cation transport ATPase
VLRRHGCSPARQCFSFGSAPALTSADAGISIGSVTDWGPNTPSAILVDEDLTKFAKLIDLRKNTMRTVRQNLVWSTSRSIAGIVLAVYGMLNPVLAAFFAPASSLVVVGN